MSGNLRLRIGAGLGAATVLLAVAAISALGMQSDARQGGSEVLAAAGSSIDGLALEPTVPTTAAGPASTPLAAPSPPASVPAPPVTPTPVAATRAAAASAGDTPPPANPPPASATAQPVTPPPTIALRKTFAISPTSGSGSTSIRASGTGCTGASAGAALTILGPDGAFVTGDGGSAAADGTWWVPFNIGVNAAPGSYSVQAACQIGAQVLFVYPPQQFTVVG